MAIFTAQTMSTVVLGIWLSALSTFAPLMVRGCGGEDLSSSLLSFLEAEFIFLPIRKECHLLSSSSQTRVPPNEDRNGVVVSVFDVVVLSRVETQSCVRRVKILGPRQQLHGGPVLTGSSADTRPPTSPPVLFQSGSLESSYRWVLLNLNSTIRASLSQSEHLVHANNEKQAKKPPDFLFVRPPSNGILCCLLLTFCIRFKTSPLDVRARQCSQQKKACLPNAAIQLQ